MPRQFDDLLLGSIELFCQAAEHGSFTKAAAHLGLTPAAVSRSVARIEQRLGVRLFTRTTRQIRLTEAGTAYFLQCRQALSQLLDAERELAGHQVELSGVVRVSVPTTYGHFRVLPLLPTFRKLYPKVRIDVHVGNRNIDFAEEGFDLAVRVRAPADSNLIARRLENAPLAVVAAPDYLQQAGTPLSIDDLARHECIQFCLPSTGRPVPWQLMLDGVEQAVETAGSYCCYEDVLAGVSLARAGAGVFQTLRFVVERELSEGSLVELLRPYGGCLRPVSLLYPHGKYLPLRTRAFIDFLLQSMTAMSGQRQGPTTLV